MGKRVDLSALADEPPLDGAWTPPGPATATRTVPLDRVARNPVNTRDPRDRPDKLDELVESLKLFGQLSPCAVVTHDAFVARFPERRTDVAGASYVQVNGARRHVALPMAGFTTIDIKIRDELGASRKLFVAATAAENIDRDDYDLIEEARQVELLVKECGTGKEAAEQLGRTPGWVTQRRKLLELVPALQEALRSGEVPQRDVRDLHQRSPAEQLAALEQWRAEAAEREQPPAAGESDGAQEDPAAEAQPAPQRRRSAVATAIRRLGGTPIKIAETLRAELTQEELRELGEALLNEPS